MIREAEAKDFERLQDLDQQIFDVEIDVAHLPFWDHQYPHSQAGVDYLTKAINKDEYEAYVYEQDNLVVGYIILNMVKREEIEHRKDLKLAQIDTICIDKNYRSQGIGAKLVSFAKEWAKKNKADRIMVGLITKNSRAMSFYKHCGFNDFSSVLEMDV